MLADANVSATQSRAVPMSMTVFLPSLITTEKEKIEPKTVNPKKAYVASFGSTKVGSTSSMEVKI